jgi:hypothetical protein
MIRAALIGLMLLGATTAAQAQRVSKVDGNRLMAICATKDLGECDAYLGGVADAIEAQGRAKAEACIPTAVTGQQLRDVVLKYLRDNPQSRQMHGGALTIKAFSAAFPCHR